MRRAATVILVLLLQTAAAFASERYVHVRIHDGDPGDEVRIDVPFALLRSLLANVELDSWDGGGLAFGDSHVSDIDLRQVLEALRDAPEGEFIRIRDHGDSVRVAKEAGFFLVNVDERDGERVRVRLPLAVLETLLAAGSSKLDLPAALEALAEYDGGDLITIDSSDEQVRIWIDANPGGDGD